MKTIKIIIMSILISIFFISCNDSDESVTVTPLIEEVYSESMNFAKGTSSIYVQNGVLLLQHENGPVLIYDISNDPASPNLKSSFQLPSEAYDATFVRNGNLLYIANSSLPSVSGYLYIYDITNLSNPILLNSIPFTTPHQMIIQDNYLFINNSNISAWDLTDPLTPVANTSFDDGAIDIIYMTSNSTTIYFSGRIGYTNHVINAANTSNLSVYTYVNNRPRITYDVEYCNGQLFWTSYEDTYIHYGNYNQILDQSIGFPLVFIGSENNYLYISERNDANYYNSKVHIYNVTDINNAVYLGGIDTDVYWSKSGVAIENGYIYMFSGDVFKVFKHNI